MARRSILSQLFRQSAGYVNVYHENWVRGETISCSDFRSSVKTGNKLQAVARLIKFCVSNILLLIDLLRGAVIHCWKSRCKNAGFKNRKFKYAGFKNAAFKNGKFKNASFKNRKFKNAGFESASCFYVECHILKFQKAGFLNWFFGSSKSKWLWILDSHLKPLIGSRRFQIFSPTSPVAEPSSFSAVSGHRHRLSIKVSILLVSLRFLCTRLDFFLLFPRYHPDVFLFLVLDLLPLMYPKRMFSSNSPFLTTCPKNLSCLISISLSIIRLFWILLKTNSLVLCAVYDMRSIFLRYHISTLSRSFFDSKLSVHVSHAYKSTGQT